MVVHCESRGEFTSNEARLTLALQLLQGRFWQESVFHAQVEWDLAF